MPVTPHQPSDHLTIDTKRWHSFRQVPVTALPNIWRPWILDKGSLTQRLIKASGGDFSVHVAFQGWDKPTASEALRLNLQRGQHALIREVELICKGSTWVYARSVIPATTLSGKERQLKFLGNKPLGAYLFKNPTMRRDQLEISRFNAGEQQGWGRRSVFYLSNKPLLVSELFLPHILDEASAPNR